MSQFFEDLFHSIFTPGPTPTLLIATNASFGALQVVLLALLVATYSVHFAVLSVLCAGLWASINWFAREIQATKEMEDRAKREAPGAAAGDDSGTETEEPLTDRKRTTASTTAAATTSSLQTNQSVSKRRSLAESGTDSEWDKVESEVDVSAEE